MVRVTCSVARKKRVKRLLKQTKGFFGDRRNHVSIARSALLKSWANSFVHRKQKKRTFRSLWIQRINAACRLYNISYSRLICGFTKAKILLDRKILAQMSVEDPKAFKGIVEKAKCALESKV